MFKRENNSTDVGLIVIVALVVIVVVWLLLTPFVSSVASSSLHRFHLRSNSFAWWSIQQPIPTMYNFANQYEVSEIPPGLVDPLFAEFAERRYINHFPVRVWTFANGRARYLNDGKDRWLTVQSAYRGLSLETRFHAEPVEGGGYHLIRLSQQESDR